MKEKKVKKNKGKDDGNDHDYHDENANNESVKKGNGNHNGPMKTSIHERAKVDKEYKGGEVKGGSS